MKILRRGLIIFFSLISGNLYAEDAALSTYKTLTPSSALKAAQAAQAACRKAGFQVSVAVLDRSGGVLVLLRDQLAGIFTPDIAQRKARTALSFRVNSSEVEAATTYDKNISGIRHVPGAIAVGGGVLVQAAGSVVGAIGISGAPQSSEDEKCALAGIGAIQTDIEF